MSDTLTCPACRRAVADDVPHRHRATVSVPVERWDYSGQRPSRSVARVRVGVLVDLARDDGEDPVDEAIARGVEAVHGRRAWFWRDSGVPEYGQIMRYARDDNGSDAVTGRVGEPYLSWVAFDD